MKKFRNTMFLIVLGTICVLSACKNNDDPKPADPTEEATSLLINKGTWTASAVTVPEGAATSATDWQGDFSVVFSATSMTTSGHPSGSEVVWPSTSWSWQNNSTEVILRGDGVEMQVNSLTVGQLDVTFTMPAGTNINGRTFGLEGEWRFVLE